MHAYAQRVFQGKYLTYVAIGDEKKIKIKISKTKQKNN